MSRNSWIVAVRLPMKAPVSDCENAISSALPAPELPDALRPDAITDSASGLGSAQVTFWVWPFSFRVFERMARCFTSTIADRAVPSISGK